jgi:hypothetical protein
MVASDLNNRPPPRRGRHAELVSQALHDQGRHAHRVELAQAARPCFPAGAARRLKRESEAKHSDRTGFLRGSARHTCARGSTACDERQSAQLSIAQVVDYRDPGSIELACRRR